ncbi:GTPase Obg [compost metagenome]
MLIHLIDGTQDDVAHIYEAVRYELAAYADVLADKPEIVVLNKVDALTPDEIKAKVKALKKVSKAEIRQVSGATGAGVEQVLFDVLNVLDAEKAAVAEAERKQIEGPWTP